MGVQVCKPSPGCDCADSRLQVGTGRIPYGIYIYIYVLDWPVVSIESIAPTG
jgi:hypothetical protein